MSELPTPDAPRPGPPQPDAADPESERFFVVDPPEGASPITPPPAPHPTPDPAPAFVPPAEAPADPPSAAPDGPSPDPTAPAADVEGAPSPTPSRGLAPIATWLEARGAGPWTLTACSLGLAGLAVFAFAVDHPGLAAVLGLPALLLSELALIPRGDETAPSARALSLLVDLMMGAGLVAAATSGFQVLVALIVLALLAWLPWSKAVAPTGLLPPAFGLWRRPDRLTILLIAAFLGRPLIGLLLVAAVGIVDVWLRTARLVRTTSEVPARLRFLDPLLIEQGVLHPVVRWGSLALAVLVLLVLGRGADWRF